MRQNTNPPQIQNDRTTKRGPQRLRPHSQNLAVPPSLQPLAQALEANSVLVDRDAVTAEMESLSRQAASNDVRLRGIVELFDLSEGGSRTVKHLGVSGRSHAFLDLGAGGVWKVQDMFLLPRPGTTLVSVATESRPFRMLAHLADDTNLIMASRSRDVYAWLAVHAGVPRRLAKSAMLRVLALGQPHHRLLETAHDVAADLTVSPEDAVQQVCAVLEEQFGVSMAYLAGRAEYEPNPALAVQAATNRVGNAALVRAHQVITDATLGVPVVTGGPSEVIYEVPNDRLDDLELRFHALTIDAEGIRMPIHADILRRS